MSARMFAVFWNSSQRNSLSELSGALAIRWKRATSASYCSKKGSIGTTQPAEVENLRPCRF